LRQLISLGADFPAGSAGLIASALAHLFPQTSTLKDDQRTSIIGEVCERFVFIALAIGFALAAEALKADPIDDAYIRQKLLQGLKPDTAPTDALPEGD
jgi:hypothetical protein